MTTLTLAAGTGLLVQLVIKSQRGKFLLDVVVRDILDG